MKNNIEKAKNWLKEQNIEGCITGSSMLDYFEGQDVDCFVYDEKSFNKVLFAMYHSDMFQLLDDLEEWKFNQYIDTINNKSPFGVTTIKFYYNTCIPVNIILKTGCNNIMSVLSSFDMDIVCIGYDIKTKQILDLTGDSHKTKIVNWNRWNINFYSPELWKLTRILRQLERCIKYYERGYNTDLVVKKFIKLINIIQKKQDIFNSEKYTEKLDELKANTEIIKKICKVWLKTHSINEEEKELLKSKIKNF